MIKIINRQHFFPEQTRAVWTLKAASGINALYYAGLRHIQNINRERRFVLKQEGFKELRQWLAYFDNFWSTKLKKMENFNKLNNKQKKAMNNQNFTTAIVVDQTPKQAFHGITNVRGWWSQNIEGGTAKLNDVFTYRITDLHQCTMKLIEVVPDKKVVWYCLDNYFKFTEDKTEWIGNKLIFDIAEKDGKTRVTFTHKGLTSAYECYDICNTAWSDYITNSLRNLIAIGKGNPNKKESEE